MKDSIQGIINPDGKKNFTPTDILKARERLVNNFGGKIAGELKPSWTAEEKVASVAYQTLTEQLYKVVPEAKTSDKIHRFYLKNEVNNIFELLLRYVVKIFWIVFVIAIFLALLKFVFH